MARHCVVGPRQQRVCWKAPLEPGIPDTSGGTRTSRDTCNATDWRSLLFGPPFALCNGMASLVCSNSPTTILLNCVPFSFSLLVICGFLHCHSFGFFYYTFCASLETTKKTLIEVGTQAEPVNLRTCHNMVDKRHRLLLEQRLALPEMRNILQQQNRRVIQK